MDFSQVPNSSLNLVSQNIIQLLPYPHPNSIPSVCYIGERYQQIMQTQKMPQRET